MGDQQCPLIPLLPLFSSTQNTLWAVDISIEVKSSLPHAQNGFDMRSGIRLSSCSERTKPVMNVARQSR
jgi:hypothetical protein